MAHMPLTMRQLYALAGVRCGAQETLLHGMGAHAHSSAGAGLTARTLAASVLLGRLAHMGCFALAGVLAQSFTLSLASVRTSWSCAMVHLHACQAVPYEAGAHCARVSSCCPDEEEGAGHSRLTQEKEEALFTAIHKVLSEQTHPCYLAAARTAHDCRCTHLALRLALAHPRTKETAVWLRRVGEYGLALVAAVRSGALDVLQLLLDDVLEQQRLVSPHAFVCMQDKEQHGKGNNDNDKDNQAHCGVVHSEASACALSRPNRPTRRTKASLANAERCAEVWRAVGRLPEVWLLLLRNSAWRTRAHDTLAACMCRPSVAASGSHSVADTSAPSSTSALSSVCPREDGYNIAAQQAMRAVCRAWQEAYASCYYYTTMRYILCGCGVGQGAALRARLARAWGRGGGAKSEVDDSAAAASMRIGEPRKNRRRRRLALGSNTNHSKTATHHTTTASRTRDGRASTAATWPLKPVCTEADWADLPVLITFPIPTSSPSSPLLLTTDALECDTGPTRQTPSSPTTAQLLRPSAVADSVTAAEWMRRHRALSLVQTRFARELGENGLVLCVTSMADTIRLLHAHACEEAAVTMRRNVSPSATRSAMEKRIWCCAKLRGLCEAGRWEAVRHMLGPPPVVSGAPHDGPQTEAKEEEEDVWEAAVVSLLQWSSRRGQNRRCEVSSKCPLSVAVVGRILREHGNAELAAQYERE